jgi:hypothetical protein
VRFLLSEIHAQVISHRRAIAFYVVLYLLILRPFASWVLCRPGKWGPEVRADVPGATYVVRVRPNGGESDEQFVVRKQGREHIFTIQEIHGAKYLFVELFTEQDGGGVWVQARGEVICSYDPEDNSFFPEGVSGHPFAIVGQGKRIGGGWTCSLWQWLWPA